MTVYVIRRRGDDSGVVKIGFTENLDRRLYDLATAFPEGFDILHSINAGRVFEKLLHKLFNSQRIAREWFKLSDDEILSIGNLDPIQDLGTPPKATIPSSDDEFSDDIVKESRFYLNELVRREWMGMGDTIEDARDRVMASCGLTPSQGVGLWHKSSAMKDVAGQVYRNLRLKYAHCLRVEGRLNDNQASFLRVVERSVSQ